MQAADSSLSFCMLLMTVKTLISVNVYSETETVVLHWYSWLIRVMTIISLQTVYSQYPTLNVYI